MVRHSSGCRFVVDLCKVEEVIDHVNEVEAAFLHLLDKRPVKCSAAFEKIDTAQDALVRNIS